MKHAGGESVWKRLLCGAAWASVIALWVCAAVPYISPAHCRWLGVVGLGFPFFLGGALLMLLLCLLFLRRRAWIPLLGLCVAFPTVRTYYPINLSSPPPKGAIQVLSYNTCGYGTSRRDADGRLSVLNYLVSRKADIICLQEAAAWPPNLYNTEIRPTLQRAGTTHFDSVNIADNIYAIHSRFPIVDKEVICSHDTNGAAAFRLVMAPGDTLIVVNCHLASMRLSQSDRDIYRTMVKHPDSTDVDDGSRLLLSKISRAAVLRAEQADSVAAYLERHRGKSIILCGDFNDSPVSYTRRRIARHLTDAYRSTGNGLGRSFNRDAIVVRIDYMMCSEDWRPFACTVDTSTQASDHYPIYAYFKRK